jgi:CBS domain-containing protein
LRPITISKSLAPLRNLLAAALTRRSGSFWQERAPVLAALRSFALADFVEPAPQPLLAPETTLRDLTWQFAHSANELFYVVSAGDRLEGLVTLTDLIRAQSDGLPPESPVRDFMARNPAAVCATDTALVAASAFREHNYKTLPVVADPASRRVVGLIRARRLIARLLDSLPPPA